MPAADAQTRIAEAIFALRAGELVIYPTETFYGIAADSESPRALDKLLSLKGRGPNQAIALVAANRASAFAMACEIPPIAHRLATSFWPGPLTLVLPARPGLHPALLGPSGVGVRVSSHPMATALAAGLGRPITATSANLSGNPPAVTTDEVRELGRLGVKVILEDGTLAGGAPSTVVVVDRAGYTIIRHGAVSERQIAAVAGLKET
jgi:L-threonylcarbamoyladenylate synthase